MGILFNGIDIEEKLKEMVGVINELQARLADLAKRIEMLEKK